MYEMATGRLPFAGISPSETVNNVLDREPGPLAKLEPRHPKGLEAIVHRLLAKRASDRYASAADLSTALASLAVTLAPRRKLWRRLMGS
jgi:serine/threonine protein kinase